MVQLTSKSHHESILASLHQMMLQGQLSDVTVQVDHQGDVQEFQAHQVMLAASSGYFKKVLLSQGAARDKLLLSDIHSSDFSKFLEFVYTGKVEVSRDKIGDVQAAAQFLDCEDLSVVCGEAMSAGILQKHTKKTPLSNVGDKDDINGAEKEQSLRRPKKQPKSLFPKRQLSPQSSENEVVSKRIKAQNVVRDEKRQGRKLWLRSSGRKVPQRRLNSKRETLKNNVNQVTSEDIGEYEDRTEAEAQPENEMEKGDERLLALPVSDGDDWESEEDLQSDNPEDHLLLSLEEQEDDEEEEEEGQSKETSKRTSKAQFQCNKCQRTFHYERSYLKHIR